MIHIINLNGFRRLVLLENQAEKSDALQIGVTVGQENRNMILSGHKRPAHGKFSGIDEKFQRALAIRRIVYVKIYMCIFCIIAFAADGKSRAFQLGRTGLPVSPYFDFQTVFSKRRTFVRQAQSAEIRAALKHLYIVQAHAVRSGFRRGVLPFPSGAKHGHFVHVK